MVAWKSETNFNEMNTVLIISQDTEMIDVWKTLFEQKNCHVISETSTGEALQASRLLSTALIVLDLNLPDVNGVDGLIRLRQQAAGVPVLVVSSLTDARVINAALQAGAAGFVPKHSQRDIFRAAFATLAAGGTYTPEGYQPPALGGPAPSAKEEAIARLGLLTRQQAVILQLICEGKLNKQIAYDLSIAETTVKAHVTAIMRKLGVYSRTQAVLLAREVNFAALLSGHDRSA